jgi:hypothetical protein
MDSPTNSNKKRKAEQDPNMDLLLQLKAELKEMKTEMTAELVAVKTELMAEVQ